jgi:hypothetical protein
MLPSYPYFSSSFSNAIKCLRMIAREAADQWLSLIKAANRVGVGALSFRKGLK